MPQQEAKKQRKRNTILFSVLYILVIFVVMAVVLFQEDNFDDMIRALETISHKWFLLAVVCALGFLLVEGGAMYFTIRWLSPERVNYFRALRTALVGQFYSCITPSSTGGQPMQVLDMHQNGIGVVHATTVVVVRFVTHEIAIFVFTLAGFVTQYAFIKAQVPSFIPFGFLGTGLALFCVLTVGGATISRRATRKLCGWLVTLLEKLHLCRDRQKMHDQLEGVLNDFNEAGNYLLEHKTRFFVLTAFDLMFFVLYFSVTFCLYRAFGLTTFGYWQIVLLHAFVHSMIYFFPLPGASGASEGSFMMLFSRVFPGGTMMTVTLLWRFLTYYIKIICGAVGVVWGAAERALRGKKKSVQEG